MWFAPGGAAASGVPTFPGEVPILAAASLAARASLRFARSFLFFSASSRFFSGQSSCQWYTVSPSFWWYQQGLVHGPRPPLPESPGTAFRPKRAGSPDVAERAPPGAAVSDISASYSAKMRLMASTTSRGSPRALVVRISCVIRSSSGWPRRRAPVS